MGSEKKRDDQLNRYLRNQLKKGHKKEDLIRHLENHGYDKDIVSLKIDFLQKSNHNFFKNTQNFCRKIENLSVPKLLLIYAVFVAVSFLISSLGTSMAYDNGPLSGSISFNSELGHAASMDFVPEAKLLDIQKFLSIFLFFSIVFFYIIYFFIFLRLSKTGCRFKDILKTTLAFYTIPLIIFLMSLIINIICYLFFERFSSIAYFFFPLIGQFMFINFVNKEFRQKYEFNKRKLFWLIPTIILIILTLAIFFLVYIYVWLILDRALTYFGVLG